MNFVKTGRNRLVVSLVVLGTALASSLGFAKDKYDNRKPGAAGFFGRQFMQRGAAIITNIGLNGIFDAALRAIDNFRIFG